MPASKLPLSVYEEESLLDAAEKAAGTDPPLNTRLPSEEQQLKKQSRTAKALQLVGLYGFLGLLVIVSLRQLGAGWKRDSGAVRVEVKKGTAFQTNLSWEPPTTRYYDFQVAAHEHAPDGFSKPMLLVNGIYPGPTIEANTHDRIIVNVTNRLNVSTSIHWHGLSMRDTPYYDGTVGVSQCAISPGESFIYNFTLDGFAGTTWWHAHAYSQYIDGLTGAIVIHGETTTLSAYAQDIVLQLSDLYHDVSTNLVAQYLAPASDELDRGNEPVPDSGTINGIGQYGGLKDDTTFFNLTLASSTTYRLRLINTGAFAPIRFSIDSHVLTVVEGDATEVLPIPVSSVVIDVGQRYSVLLTTGENTGSYWMRAELQTQSFKYDNAGANHKILGIMQYGTGNEVVLPVQDTAAPALVNLPELDVQLLTPAVAKAAPMATKSFVVSTSMMVASNGAYLAFMNSTSWEPERNAPALFTAQGNSTSGPHLFGDSQLMFTTQEPEVVDVIFNNYDDGSHVWHLHGYSPFLIASGRGRYSGQDLNLNNENPMHRDTFTLPPFSWYVIRYVADNPGVWLLHCHYVFHMEAGLAMLINTMPKAAAALGIPADMRDMCKKT